MAALPHWVGESIGISALPRDAASGLRRLNFEAMETGAAFAYDGTRSWREVTNHALDIAWRPLTTLPEPLRTAELTHLQKMGVCWRDRGVGRFVFEEPFVTSNPEQAAWLEPWLKAMGDEYVAYLSSLGGNQLRALALGPDGPTLVTNKGKGTPCFMKGTDRFAADEYAAASGFARGYTLQRSLAVARQLHPLGAIATMQQRIQAARKMVEARSVVGGYIVPSGERVGPKAREVKAVSFWVNWYLVVLAWLTKICNRGTSPVAQGDTVYAKQIASARKYSFGADLSTFDDTIAYETLALWRRHVAQKILSRFATLTGLLSEDEVALILEISEYVATIDVLCPPRWLGESGCIIPSLGRVKSGEYTTSVVDTDIRKAMLQAKLSALSASDALWTVWGDDCLVASDDPSLAERFGGTWYGFKETSDPEPSFLMKHMPEGYGYVGRMLLRTINREAMEEPDNIGMAACSIAIRRGLLRGHPQEHLYINSILSAPGRLGVAARLAGAMSPEAAVVMMAQLGHNNRQSQLFHDRDDMERARDIYGDQFDSMLSLYSYTEEEALGRNEVNWFEFRDKTALIDPDRARKSLGRRMDKKGSPS